MMKRMQQLLAAFAFSMMAVPAANATSIFLAECIFLDTCWTASTPTPWSASLDATDLASLGLGTSQPFIAAQDSPFVIQLGVTTITFSTPGGPVVVMIGEFTGGFNDPCTGLCEIDIVAMVLIPIDATSAMISGTFGNSTVPNSAGVNLCLGDGPGACAAVPEPGTLALMAVALGVLGFARRRRESA